MLALDIPRRLGPSQQSKVQGAPKAPTPTPSESKAEPNKPFTSIKGAMQHRQIELQFKNKKKQFEQMKKDVEKLQQPLMETFKVSMANGYLFDC